MVIYGTHPQRGLDQFIDFIRSPQQIVHHYIIELSIFNNAGGCSIGDGDDDSSSEDDDDDRPQVSLDQERLALMLAHLPALRVFKASNLYWDHSPDAKPLVGYQPRALDTLSLSCLDLPEPGPDYDWHTFREEHAFIEFCSMFSRIDNLEAEMVDFLGTADRLEGELDGELEEGQLMASSIRDIRLPDHFQPRAMIVTGLFDSFALFEILKNSHFTTVNHLNCSPSTVQICRAVQQIVQNVRSSLASLYLDFTGWDPDEEVAEDEELPIPFDINFGMGKGEGEPEDDMGDLDDDDEDADFYRLNFSSCTALSEITYTLTLDNAKESANNKRMLRVLYTSAATLPTSVTAMYVIFKIVPDTHSVTRGVKMMRRVWKKLDSTLAQSHLTRVKISLEPFKTADALYMHSDRKEFTETKLHWLLVGPALIYIVDMFPKLGHKLGDSLRFFSEVQFHRSAGRDDN
ncbi:hypothetical protein EIP91_002728 [Steccherinum ochraceum]|uniref:Uncharacterized protein n=1 Tax=Steccherinum ochraceum TaxID=92696 RepID=A0A4R0RSD5_9APHY|nr:hypothetical protein EIP91_002728 [Steccherinum ochraceum]